MASPAKPTDFEDTMNLINDIGFDMSFSFIYSARPGTPAADLPDDVEMDVKNSGWRFFSSVSAKTPRTSPAKWWAAPSAFWWMASPKRTRASSRAAPNNRVVNFQCDDTDLIGQFVDVTIAQAYSNSLLGTDPRNPG